MKISLRGSVTEDYKYGDKKTNHSLSQNTLTGLASEAVLWENQYMYQNIIEI